MKKFKQILSILAVFLLVFISVGCNKPNVPSVTIANGYEIENVIVLIGDGVGFNHYKNAGVSIEAVFSGRMTTNSFGGVVTDSAAAATAMATGYKVLNGRIGVNNKKNISEIAIEKGKKAGIITTDNIYGATPSGFSARANNRGDTSDIIRTQKASEISLFMGQTGSHSYNDDRFITYENPKLRQLIEEALDYLDSYDGGFFLMAECSRTDTYSHQNNLSAMIQELLDFKEAIEYVLNWASGRKDTAIIITSDHETGGLTTSGAYTSTGHTDAKVPLYFYNFVTNKNEIKNTELFEIMKKLM